jgi:uncharacterized membrane protein (Fun14 family)
VRSLATKGVSEVNELDQATQITLLTLGTEIGTGVASGFFVGWGLRLVLSLMFKVLAVAVAAFVLPLMALAGLGVVKVDFTAFAALIQKVFVHLIDFVVYVTPTLVQYFPLSGSFGLGVIIGGMKK